MNYIKHLEAQNAEAFRRLVLIEERVAELRAHLQTPKFHAEQPDGSRGDWIAVADVQRWLTYITED